MCVCVCIYKCFIHLANVFFGANIVNLFIKFLALFFIEL